VGGGFQMGQVNSWQYRRRVASTVGGGSGNQARKIWASIYATVGGGIANSRGRRWVSLWGRRV